LQTCNAVFAKEVPIQFPSPLVKPTNNKSKMILKLFSLQKFFNFCLKYELSWGGWALIALLKLPMQLRLP
jgi:hypothetical protein